MFLAGVAFSDVCVTASDPPGQIGATLLGAGVPVRRYHAMTGAGQRAAASTGSAGRLVSTCDTNGEVIARSRAL